MSTIALGKTFVLKLGRSGGNLSTFTGQLEGTDALTMTEQRDVRPIPGGRGVLAAQEGSFSTHNATLVCDSNETHDGVLLGQNVRRLHFAAFPEGESAGLPQFTGEVVVTLRLAADVARDTFRWNVQMAVDGAPTEGTV